MSSQDKHVMSKELVRDIIRWDIYTWQAIFEIWEKHLPQVLHSDVLEIGAYEGGLSLYFALKGGNVICSDIRPPSPAARELHDKYRVSDEVKYDTVDVLNIKYADDSFDIVCFKSLLSIICPEGNSPTQRRALSEIRRVLRPGGMLMFADNMEASRLHAFLRKRFVEWGARTGYLPFDSLDSMLAAFVDVHTSFHGFFSVFGRTDLQRRILHAIDAALNPIISDKMKYAVIGCARKPAT